MKNYIFKGALGLSYLLILIWAYTKGTQTEEITREIYRNTFNQCPGCGRERNYL